MTHREGLAVTAVNLLNKAKGLNYQLEDVKEEIDGEVSFKCTYPSGGTQTGAWPTCGFDPDGDGPSASYSGISEELLEKVKQYTGDDKVLARMMAYLWTVRNHKE